MEFFTPNCTSLYKQKATYPVTVAAELTGAVTRRPIVGAVSYPEMSGVAQKRSLRHTGQVHRRKLLKADGICYTEQNTRRGGVGSSE